MQLKTILNYVTDYKSFVFGKVTWLLLGPCLLRLRSSSAGLRHAARTSAVRVYSTVGDHCVFCLPNAASSVCQLRHQGGTSALGRRQELADDRIQVVPRSLGATHVVDRCFSSLPCQLGPCLRGREIRGFLGPSAS